jgi:cytosine/adenosine deaminase-related metal-dependent hydrolase
MLAPSAPQRCSDQFLISCGKLAADFDLGMHTHLSETKLHAETARTIYGEPMVTHLNKIGFINSKLSMAHSIWLEDEEIDLLAEHGVKVVHNPACNMKLGDGVAQVKKMLEKGISVGLGSDSVNAGTVYSVFEQMKLAVLLPRVMWGPENWVRPVEAFEMGCLGGAKVVLQDESLGSIEEGKKADLVILNPSMSLSPVNNLINQLVLSENGNSVETVFVDGRAVMLEKQIQTVDEPKIITQLSSFCTRISGAYKEVSKKKGAKL